MNKLLWLHIIGIGCSVLFPSAPTRAQPDIAPPPKIKIAPQPNARDFFIKAGNALVGRDRLGTELTGPEKQQLVERNAEALRILREGFSYEYQQTLTVFDEAALNTNTKLRALARLLVVEGQIHAARGDKKRAVNSFLDALRLGIEPPHGAPLIGDLTGVATETIGRRALWEISDKLDAATARQAARRLEIIEARRQPFAQTLRNERIIGEVDVREHAQRIHNPEWNQQTAMARYASFMEAEIAEAQLPYITSTQRPTSTEFLKDADEYAKAVDAKAANTIELLFKMNKSNINSTRFQIAKSQTQNAVLTVTLALLAYKLEHGNFPASLTQLVPDCLEQIPSDPFAARKPLQYRVQGDKYVLYSVGPDGEDDGGQPVDAAKTKNTQAESKGDLVAGVNVR